MGTIELINTRNNEKTRWRVFNKDLKTPYKDLVPKGKEGIKETRIVVAFPEDQVTRGKIKERANVVYCYLPTKKRTDLPFLIQADFLPTIGRENIEDNEWNRWLLEELGILSGAALENLKDEKKFSEILYELIPLKHEIEDELIKNLGDSLYKELCKKKIAKTVSEKWVLPKKCTIPSDERIRKIIFESDLKAIFKEKLYYSSPKLDDQAREILFELGSIRVDKEHVIELIKNRNRIKVRTRAWFLDLYDYLSSIFERKTYSWEKWEDHIEALFEELKKIPFLLTEKSTLVPIEDPKMPDRLICYPQNISLSEVQEYFTEGEIVFLNKYLQESGIIRRKEKSPEIEDKRKRVKEWLTWNEIGVKKYFKQYHIINEVILPKFSSGKYRNYNDLKIYGLIDYIRNNLSSYETEVRKRKTHLDEETIFDEIKENLLVKCFYYENGKRLEAYKKPNETYFSKQYGNQLMEELFDGVEGVYFISPYYIYREKKEKRKKRPGRQKARYSWRKFFKLMGVWNSPIVIKNEEKVPISGKEGYKWIDKEYSPSGLHQIEDDSDSPHIIKLIEYCSALEDQNKINRRLKLLWYSLDCHWNKIYKNYCKSKYWYFYYDWKPKEVNSSSFLELLKNAKWALSYDGSVAKPTELFRDTKQNRYLLGDPAKYIGLKGNTNFLDDIGVRKEPTIDEILDHLKSFKDTNLTTEKSQIRKMGEIYTFLKRKLKEIGDEEDRTEKLDEIRKAFHDSELLYLPRKDKSWWAPRDVFLRDYSELFGGFRGYNKASGRRIYMDTLTDFLLELGASEKPTVNDCLNVLSDLKGRIDDYKSIASKIYKYIDNTLKVESTNDVNWDREVFLTEKGAFLRPQPELQNYGTRPGPECMIPK
jgi:hypothetical protein